MVTKNKKCSVIFDKKNKAQSDRRHRQMHNNTHCEWDRPLLRPELPRNLLKPLQRAELLTARQCKTVWVAGGVISIGY